MVVGVVFELAGAERGGDFHGVGLQLHLLFAADEVAAAPGDQQPDHPEERLGGLAQRVGIDLNHSAPKARWPGPERT